jgi:hypothetical protein
MCPACIGSALWLLSSAGSAGGLAAAFKLRSIRRVRAMGRLRGSDDPSTGMFRTARIATEVAPTTRSASPVGVASAAMLSHRDDRLDAGYCRADDCACEPVESLRQKQPGSVIAES